MTEQHTRVNPTVLVAVLGIAGISYAVLSAIVIPALPTLAHDLHTSETGVTWALTAYLIAAAIGTSILGRLGDMYGKTRVLLWTMVFLMVGILLAALATSLALLVCARVLQGAAGGIYPLAMGIIRDEMPRERIAGSIGLLSATLGIGSGLGIVAAGLLIEHLSWHWLFWMPLIFCAVATIGIWRLVPDSPTRVPGRVNWLAALVMAVGISVALVAVSETTVWGWGSVKTIGVLVAGLAICGAWVVIEGRSAEPLVDMTMMRVRGVWTTNAAAFLLGAGMYGSYIAIPELAQLPKSTGFGYGSSIVVSGFYLLPLTTSMMLISLMAGLISARFGSRSSLIAGAAVGTLAFLVLLILGHASLEMLVAATLIGIGIGLAFAALGNLIIGAVPPAQTGVASGMNTVTRMLGGAIGGQLSATFIAGHYLHGLPAVTGFTETFAVSAGLLAVCTAASLLVPRRQARSGTSTVEHRPPGARTALAAVGDGARETALKP